MFPATMANPDCRHKGAHGIHIFETTFTTHLPKSLSILISQDYSKFSLPEIIPTLPFHNHSHFSPSKITLPFHLWKSLLVPTTQNRTHCDQFINPHQSSCRPNLPSPGPSNDQDPRPRERTGRLCSSREKRRCCGKPAMHIGSGISH